MRHTKKAVFIGLGGLVLAGGGFFAFGSLQPSVTPEGVRMGDIDLGGLTRDDVIAKLETWWDGEKHTRIQPESKLLTKQPDPLTLEEAGVRPDWDATLAGVPFNTYFDKTFGRTGSAAEVEIAWMATDSSAEASLASFVAENAKPRRAASIRYVDGKIVREYEIPSFTLNNEELSDAMLSAVMSGEPRFELPMKKDTPKIPNEALDQIRDVMAEFTTSFSTGQYNRSSNIRLACNALTGVILMPGETLSYNDRVGKRTPANGYRDAPVFKNGLKVLDTGGGVCQVSTTLYNAALMADLEIVNRRNHSRPVAYVPVGRDATVDYGSGIDLVFKNSYDFPIAVVSDVDGGKVTFRVLGKKDPSKSIQIVTTDHKSWGNAVKYVDDASVPPGKETVVDSGAGGRACITWRIVRIDGVEVKRENLGKSHYPGAARIIARNPAPATPVGPDGAPVIEPGGIDETRPVINDAPPTGSPSNGSNAPTGGTATTRPGDTQS